MTRANIERLKNLKKDLETSLESLDITLPEDEAILVAFTRSMTLRANAQTAPVTKYIIDIGCSYFLELTKEKAILHFNRRLARNQNDIETLQKQVSGKCRTRECKKTTTRSIQTW